MERAEKREVVSALHDVLANAGVVVVAHYAGLSVADMTKLRSDNVDPREYLDRLANWQQRVESGGGTWQVVNDLERLEKVLTF